MKSTLSVQKLSLRVNLNWEKSSLERLIHTNHTFTQKCMLVEREVWGEAGEDGIGEFGQGTEIVDGLETGALSAKSVDGLRLLVAQVRMSRQGIHGARVDTESAHIGCVCREMRQKRVHRETVMADAGEELFVQQLLRTVKTAELFAVFDDFERRIASDAPYELQFRGVASVEIEERVFLLFLGQSDSQRVSISFSRLTISF